MAKNIREPLLRIFHENIGVQLTIGEIKDRVNAKGHDFTRAQVSGALATAANQGLIDRVALGLYTYRPKMDSTGTLYETLTPMPGGETLVKSDTGEIFVIVPVVDYFRK